MSCGVCDDTHVVPAGWVFQREINCTCGAGDGEMKLHAAGCDPVPCPFCQLISATAVWPALTLAEEKAAGPCLHRPKNVKPVFDALGDHRAYLCTACDTQLPKNWAVQEEDL